MHNLAGLTALSEAELLALAAKAMGMSWPQQGRSADARSWHPGESDADCLQAIFTLGLSVDPIGFESLPAFRRSILLRMAYLGLHK